MQLILGLFKKHFLLDYVDSLQHSVWRNHSTVVRQNASSYAIPCSMNDEAFLCTPSRVVWMMKLSCVHSPVLCEWWSFPVYTVQCCVNGDAFLCTQSSVVWTMGLSSLPGGNRHCTVTTCCPYNAYGCVAVALVASGCLLTHLLWPGLSWINTGNPQNSRTLCSLLFSCALPIN